MGVKRKVHLIYPRCARVGSREGELFLFS